MQECILDRQQCACFQNWRKILFHITLMYSISIQYKYPWFLFTDGPKERVWCQTLPASHLTFLQMESPQIQVKTTFFVVSQIKCLALAICTILSTENTETLWVNCVCVFLNIIRIKKQNCERKKMCCQLWRRLQILSGDKWQLLWSIFSKNFPSQFEAWHFKQCCGSRSKGSASFCRIQIQIRT